MGDVGVYPESMQEDWRKSTSGDFVSRQWLLTEYDKRHKGPPGGARKMIEEAPAADVRPVVFCKDCKWFNPANSGWLCEFKNGLICPGEDDFCSFGERRDGGAEG